MNTGFFTPDQFMAYMQKSKCSLCEKPSKWYASLESPAYCDDHFPYHEVITLLEKEEK